MGKPLDKTLSSAFAAAKKITLLGARACGAYSAFGKSNWRKQRLLILGYHGISLQDEHAWRPGLFMTSSQFAARLETMSRMGCAVLPLGDAIDHLQFGTLPPLSVVITYPPVTIVIPATAFPMNRDSRQSVHRHDLDRIPSESTANSSVWPKLQRGVRTAAARYVRPPDPTAEEMADTLRSPHE